MVDASIDSLKMAAIALFNVTPVSASAGAVELTVGGVVSGAAPVVKLHVFATASGLPARSVAAVLIVAVKVVLAAKALVGMNVAVVPTSDTVPATAVLPGPLSV